MSGRALAEIEKQLQGAARHITPRDWLAELLPTRHIDTNAASDYLSQSAYYENARWDLPPAEDAEDEENMETETMIDPWQNENERLQQRFMDIFNDVLFFFGLGMSRRALATESTEDEDDDIFYEYETSLSDDPPRFSTRPDLLFLGEDARQLPRPLDSYNRSMSVELGNREELYRGCVAVAKVQKVDGRYGKDAILAKLVTCAQRCFSHQPGRRFVYGLALSRDCFQLVYFDRSGAVESAPLDIHANAVQLVQVVTMLGDPDLGNLGFDPSIYWENDRRYVDVLGQALGARKASSRKYEIERVVFQRPQLFNRGTTCWVVTKVGGTETVLMKDIWQEEGENEEILTHTSKQGIPGVRKLLGVDETWVRRPLSISSLRLGQSIPATGHKNRIFSRLLLELQGPSIRHFDSGLQLLQGLRDAVVAHHRLVKAGVLHRDITPDGILLSRDGGQSGPHATLIDMKNAVHCVGGRTPAEKDDPHTGTPMFRSTNNVLACTTHRQGPRRYHNFLDDLESFLWVYVWVTMVQNGPGEAAFVSEPSSCIAQMLRTDHLGLLHEVKYVFMRNDDNANPTPYFSQTPYPELLDNLRSLCEGYRGAKLGGQDLFPQMDGIYRRFLAFFDSAIEQLGGATRLASSLSPSDADPLSTVQQESKSASAFPLRQTQPDRRAKHAKHGICTNHDVEEPEVADRPGKRALEDGNATSREKKKRKLAPALLNPHSRKEDGKRPISKVIRIPQEGTRRSERVRMGKAKAS